MSWSSQFIKQLARPGITPIWILETIEAGSAPIGMPCKFASAPGYGDASVLGVRGVRVQGQTLKPSTWTTTIGAFSVDITGDLAIIHAVNKTLTRGTVCLLRMGFLGWAESDFEVVAIGMVTQLRGVPPLWTLTCTDVTSILSQRLAVAAGAQGLFYVVGGEQALTANYTAGSGTITVASTSTFSRETGGDGVAMVTPTTGDPFYVRYTGKTATTLTGVVAGFATDDASAVIGDIVTDCSFLEGHPADVFRRIVCSASGVGLYDDYPASWGLGFPDYLVDHEDIETFRDVVVVPASGAWEWGIIVTTAQDSGLDFLAPYLEAAGLFVAMRQGGITLRAGQSQGSTTYNYHTNLEITDADISAVMEWSAWDSDSAPEYATATVRTIAATLSGGEVVVEDSSTTSTSVATLPAEDERVYDMSEHVWENRSAVRAEVLARVVESATRIPERLRLRLVPLSWAQLTIGDPVFLTTARIGGRYDPTGYDGRTAIVVEVSPDYIAGSVVVGLLMYPFSADPFVA